MNFYALDLETQSLVPDHEEYALSPWRIMEGKMRILTYYYCSATKLPTSTECHPQFTEQIRYELSNQYVWTWSGVFDIACLISSGVDCSKVRWLDAMSAVKRVFRSQHTDHPSGARPVSWSLGNIVKQLLKNWEHYDELIDVKKEFSYDETYLRRRCQLDTEATLLLGELLWKRLTEQQQKALLIESESMYPLALAWMRGTKYNFARAKELEIEIVKERLEILQALDVIHMNSFTTITVTDHKIIGPTTHPLSGWEKTIGSNDQLAILMYDVWEVPFDEDLRDPKAKTDKRPVNKNVLTFLIERYGSQFPQLVLIKRYRELKSKEDKFLKGPQKAREYLGSDTMRHYCKINSAYTGRTTYGSKQ